MKASVLPTMVELDAEALKLLVAEVKETIANAIQLHEKPNRSFRVGDMWNIRKNSKSASSLVRRW
jgi:hypothetical protein